ncbi:retrovirus-related pol polyprotein from transposon TNT 1-94 [Tanacetum coccineum]
MVKPVWNNAQRVNHQNFAKKTHSYAKKNMVSRAVLVKSGLVSVNTSRQVNTAHSKTIVNAARPMSYLSKTTHSTVKRPIHKNTTFKNSNQRVNTARDKKINTARPKAVVNAVKGNNFNVVKASTCWGNPQMDLHDQGVINSGCSRHMTGNMSYLTNYEEIDGGYVAFGGNPKGGKITKKAPLKLDQGVMIVELLKHMTRNKSNLIDNDWIDRGYVAIGGTPKELIGESQVLLRVPRKNNMYSVDLKNIVPKGNLVRGLPSKLFENDQTCVACQKGKQHRASSTKDETSGILKSFITGIENLVDLKVKVIRSRTPQQNEVAERRNMTLIKAARTMLADSKLPTTFWAEVVNTACYVQNRVLVVKPHNKTPYELFHGRTPTLSFTRPFGCPVTILNTIDHLGKFDCKADEGFFVGYSLNSKTFRVFNSRTRIVEKNLHIRFSESTLNTVQQSRCICNTKKVVNAAQARKKTEPVKNYILLPLWTADLPFSHDLKSSHDDGSKPSSDGGKKVDEDPRKESKCNDQEKEDNVNSTNNVNAASTNEVNVVGGKTSIKLPFDPNMPALEDYSIFDFSRDDEDDGAEADMNNLDTTIQVSPIPTTRIHKDHPLDQVIGDLQSATQTRKMSKNLEEHGFEEPKKVIHALKDPSWIEAMQEELLQFKLVAQGYTQEEGIDYDEVFSPVARIEAIRLFLAYASFKDFVVYQMDVKSAFLYGKIEEEVYVCQPPRFEDPDFLDRVYKVEKALYGLHQAPRAWYETLSTYLLDNGFQRGKIDKTLFIKRYKGDILLMSSMGELTFFLGLQVKQKKDGIFISQDKYVDEILKKFRFTEVKTASTPMETQKPLLKDEDGKEVDVHMYRSMIGSLMYLTSSRPDIMFAVCACARYQVNPKVSHLHAVKRIFRYLKGQPKLGLWYPKDSPFDLVAYTDSDYAGASLDRKSTIGGCQFLGCRLISWQCKKQTVVANSTTEAEYVAASSCCGQVLWIQNQLLDYGLGKAKKSVRLMTRKLFGMELELMLFWSTVMAKTINGEEQLHALVDGKKIIITESSIRRDLQLADEEGVDCLPNSTIFEQLTLMGPKTTAWNEFSSTMASAIICLATNQKFNFSKFIFENKVVHKELGDSLVRVATTASSLEAEHDSGNINKTQSKATPNESSSQGTNSGGGPWCQETIGDTIAQIGFESVSKHFNDSLLARGNTLRSDEDRLKLDEIDGIMRVKKLEKKDRSRIHRLKRLYKVGLTARVESSDNEESLGEDASKQGRIDAIDADEEITLVSVHDVNVSAGEEVFATTVDDITLAQVLEEMKSTKPKKKGDKGKGILIEPMKPMNKKDLIVYEGNGFKFTAGFNEEKDLQERKWKKKKKPLLPD